MLLQMLVWGLQQSSWCCIQVGLSRGCLDITTQLSFSSFIMATLLVFASLRVYAIWNHNILAACFVGAPMLAVLAIDTVRVKLRKIL